RRIRVFVFFSLAGISLSRIGRGVLGARLVFGNAEAVSQERHERELKSLAQLRDRLIGRFAQLGIVARELSPDDVRRLHYELLNPGRGRQRLGCPEGHVRDDLWDEGTVKQAGEYAREYSEAEQLCHEDLVDGSGHL